MNVHYIHREAHLYACIYIKFNKHFNLKGYSGLLLLLGENIVNSTRMKPRAKTHYNFFDREAPVQVCIFLFSKTEAAWSLKLSFTHSITETQQCGPIKVLGEENQMRSHFLCPITFFSISQETLFSKFLKFHLFRKHIYHYFNRPPKHQLFVPKKSVFTSKGRKKNIQNKRSSGKSTCPKPFIIKLMGLIKPKHGDYIM